MLDDYACSAIACLDAYETTADLSYFHFAQKIADAMVERFYDSSEGGFFDSENRESGQGVLATPRKPFQDSPTPSGNAMAAIGLLRLHSFTNNEGYREKAKRTLELFAGIAGQHGLFAATYGIAGIYFANPHTQVVVVGDDEIALEMVRAAVAPFSLGKAVIRVQKDEAIPQKFPPALAETIPALASAQRDNRSLAIVCRQFTCQPPVEAAEELHKLLIAA
jgi:uncharacterized protein YyaL (SSP411 family)